MNNREAMTMPNIDQKRRILAVLNQLYCTSVTVEMMDVAILYGFTSWATLEAERAEAGTREH